MIQATGDMRPWLKLILIAAGYVLALLAAWTVLQVVRGTGSPSGASDGMRAFSESLLFLAVFGIAAAVPTGTALYWLRPIRLFWVISSAVALVAAGFGLTSAILHITAQASPQLAAMMPMWVSLAALRLLISPFVAGTLALLWLISPVPRGQVVLLSAALAESLVSLYAMVHWFGRLF